METHGFALVTAGKIDPSDLPFPHQLAKPGFANPEILRRLVRPQQRNGRSGFPTHGEAGGLGRGCHLVAVGWPMGRPFSSVVSS